VLQCVAVCCSVLQCVVGCCSAVCYSVAVCYNEQTWTLHRIHINDTASQTKMHLTCTHKWHDIHIIFCVCVSVIIYYYKDTPNLYSQMTRYSHNIHIIFTLYSHYVHFSNAAPESKRYVSSTRIPTSTFAHPVVSIIRIINQNAWYK